MFLWYNFGARTVAKKQQSLQATTKKSLLGFPLIDYPENRLVQKTDYPIFASTLKSAVFVALVNDSASASVSPQATAN